MQTKRMLLAAGTALLLSAATAQAGPCSTGGTSANRDAGSGPTVGATSQTTGSTQSSNQHPPTDTMNRATGGVATSSQDFAGTNAGTTHGRAAGPRRPTLSEDN